MTRTRTQTALTKLVTLLANINGELAYLEALERLQVAADEALLAGLRRRQMKLHADRDAVVLTLRQFDPGLDVAEVGAAAHWLKPFGRGRAAVKRYEGRLRRGDFPSL